METWFFDDATSLLRIGLSVVGIFIAVIALTKWNGLRTYSKMESFDFAITVAVGSLLATTAVSSKLTVLGGATALFVFFVCQRTVTALRARTGLLDAIDNTPAIVMVRGEHLEDVLERVRVTKDDITAKLREANVVRLDQVEVVVLESTGSISVLHSDDVDQIDEELLSGVSNPERYREYLSAA